jgi:POT family proton-dependent oligopeptide transporter
MIRLKKFYMQYSDQQTISSRQPRQIYILFFAEMWERFSFYGMKALLLAYMVTQLHFGEEKGYGIFGAYTALVFTMPLLGGWVADEYLGYRRSIIFGGILMAMGHLLLAVPEQWSFYYGMAFIICGNGFFKPNISSMVGTLYEKNDPRKDSGFSLFYTGINIGATLGGLVCGYVGQRINWHYGFGLAGIFMLLGLVIFYFGQHQFQQKGLPPDIQKINKKISGLVRTDIFIYVAVILMVPLIAGIFDVYDSMQYIMTGLGLGSLVYIILISKNLDKAAVRKLAAAVILIIFSIFFWAFYEQYAGSLNLFALRNVDMHVAGIELPALSVNNSLPPAWVIVLSFLFSRLWLWLNRRKLEPSTPAKFALSFIFMAIGFSVFWLACKMNGDSGLIPLWTLALGYFFVIAGEVCISPIGLSMITKLSPPKMVALMMGVWFFATAVGELLASKIGAMMSVPDAVQNNPVASMPYYGDILYKIFIACAVTGGLMILLTPVIKKWMQDVR